MKKFIVVFFVSLIGLPSFSQLVAPQKGTGSKYFFSSYNIYFEVDTTNGARISSFKINNNEILYNQSTQNMNGSTFWPSPQSLWGWPPLSAIDNKPYKINISNNKLIATSSIDTKLKIRVIKKFFFDSRDTSIHINYCIKNENNVQKKYAHWEITRVPADGLVFFAKGQTDVSGNMATSVQEINGIYWYDQVNTISGDKFFCDGEGWLAFINQSNYLFVKKFANINSSAAATGEAEVEVIHLQTLLILSLKIKVLIQVLILVIQSGGK